MSTYTDASLIYYPSGYKAGKAYSLKPTDGSGDLTFTRASTATRVNAEGLVEVVPWNLFNYSEDFTNGYWYKGAALITANATTAPNGTTTADKFDETATNDTHQVYNIFTGNTGVATLFVYAKKAERSGLQITSDQATDPSAIFNLDTGVVYSSANCTAFIESVGNGWYKCGITYTIDQTTSYPVFRITDASFQVVYSGTAGYGIYIWGAQLNIGSTAKPYFQTTDRLNVPRIDYTGGGCGKLLLEPQRTNLFPYSEAFDNAAWAKEDLSVSANATTSPDGTLNADLLLPNTNNTDHSIYDTTNSATEAFTIFLKAGGYNYAFLGKNNNYAADGAFFDLANGVVSQNTSTLAASIEDYGNGWYRCSLVGSFSTTYRIICTSENGTSFIHAGDGIKGVYAWGAQGEAGSYSTSLINTSGTAVTRLADSASKSGISSLIGQTEGTIFFDGVINGAGNTSTNIINSEKNTTCSFYIQRVTGSSQINAGFIFSGSTTAVVNGGTFAVGQRIKIGWAYKSGSNALYVNGSLIDSNTTTFTPPSTFDDLFLNDDTTYFGYQEAVEFNQVAVFKTRLSNAELATLTTL